MRLADVRRLAIRRGARLAFRLSSGLECVIDEHGVARVPGLAGPPGFSLEEELSKAERFTLEPANAEGKKGKPAPQSLARQELEALAVEKGRAAAAQDGEE
jgi:hypothetical protein